MKWEYTYWTALGLDTTIAQAHDAITELGQQGWELAAVAGAYFWFKRPCQ